MSVQTNYIKFFDAETLFGPFSPDSTQGRGIWKFGGDVYNTIPYCIRTGHNGLGDPLERKTFEYVDIHAEGAVNGRIGMRVFIDGRFICSGAVTASTQPTMHRRVNLPISKSTGHTIDIELAGNVRLRAVSVTWNGVA